MMNGQKDVELANSDAPHESTTETLNDGVRPENVELACSDAPHESTTETLNDGVRPENVELARSDALHVSTIETLNDCLRKKDEELARLKSQLESEKKSLSDESRKKETLQDELNQIKKKLTPVESELKDVKTKYSTDMRQKEGERQLAERKLLEKNADFAESSKKWNKDRRKRQEAEENVHKREQEKNILVQHVRTVTDKCVALKEAVGTASFEHENKQRELQEKIGDLSSANSQLQARTEEIERAYEEKLEEAEIGKRDLTQQLTNYKYLVSHYLGANEIAHTWVKQMSEHCAICKINQEQCAQELIQVRGLLEKKEADMEALRNEIRRRDEQIQNAQIVEAKIKKTRRREK